jgi:ribosomal-protein-alanine N-acetyltransferase
MGTTRLYLRPPCRADWRQWASLREQSREFLQPWEPTWPPDDLSWSAFKLRLKGLERDQRLGSTYSFLIFRRGDDRLLGGLSLYNVRGDTACSGTLGYWIGQPFARSGYMSEALAALLDFCFEELKLNRVEAACLPENEASQRLLRKAGFVREGFARQYLSINGAWRDHLLFALLAEDRRRQAAALGVAGFAR